MNKIIKEEIIVPLLIFVSLAIAFSPFVYELVSISKALPGDRYPLVETEFPPDQRVYLSRMNLGYQGAWLVKEKFTSEPHRPTLLHEGYLLMGKLTGFLGLDPVQAFPVWRLIGGALMLTSGYFLLLKIFPEKKLRLAAFVLFIFAGNWPIAGQNGIEILGQPFSLVLGWFTFFDPVRRLVFLPHYTFAASFMNLALRDILVKNYHRAGIWAFLAGMFIPQSLLVIIFVVGVLNLFDFGKIKRNISCQWLFWALITACLVLLKISISYFPWNLQLPADAGKRNLIPFNPREILLALGTTGIFGFVGAFYLLWQKQKRFYPVCLWLVSIILLVILFKVFPFSNQWRFMQIDLHLCLAVCTVGLLDHLLGKLKSTKSWLLWLPVVLLLLPSFVVWPVSLRSAVMFSQAKIKAGYPSIPKLPYVVYPVKTVMEGIFWLRDSSLPDEVVLAGETLGSMIPAYSGNTTYLGHGNQTAFFNDKMARMTKFFRGEMTAEEKSEFLRLNGIRYIFYGPEEREIGKLPEPVKTGAVVFQNSEVTIFSVRQ